MTNNAQGASGIMTRSYKSGSIIYFENDKSEYIYVLKAGKVVLTSVKLDTGEEVKEEVRHGEFFGVKSALGKYPREETAQTVGETVVLVMNLSDFERLVLRNVTIVRKMLRVFSNQLRRIHKMVRSVLGEGDTINPDVELFRIGEFYYNSGILQHAEYAFKRYMEYYPDSQYAEVAMQKIKAISTGQVIPSDDFSAVPPAGAENEASFEVDFDAGEPAGNSNDSDMLDFEGGGDSLSNEMDSFLSSDRANDSMSDFTFSEPVDNNKNAWINDEFDNAQRLYASGGYQAAKEMYDKISKASSNNPDDQKYIENSAFEKARCEMKLGEKKEALQSFAAIVKNTPNSKFVKNSLFYIGSIFESINQKDKAINYFKKVSTMPPKDRTSEQAIQKINQLGG